MKLNKHEFMNANFSIFPSFGPWKMVAVASRMPRVPGLGLGQSYLECSCWEHQVLRPGQNTFASYASNAFQMRNILYINVFQ
jgi:hypothetical protein